MSLIDPTIGNQHNKYKLNLFEVRVGVFYEVFTQLFVIVIVIGSFVAKSARAHQPEL